MSSTNVVYVSGTHGSGKSTLIGRLIGAEPTFFHKFERLDIPKCDETVERAKIRLVRYYLHTFYEDQQVKEHPCQVLLCDRSALDNLAYVAGFKKLGWVSPEQYDQYLCFFEYLFPPERRPKNVVFVNPSLDTTIKHLKKRWESEPKKWCEDNFEYLAAVREGFQELYVTYPGNVLDLQGEHLDERVEQCMGWIRSWRVSSEQEVVSHV